MKKIVVVMLMLFIGLSVNAQIPEQIKTRLIELTKKVDKLSDISEIEKQISVFTSNAPSAEMKKTALNLMKSKSKSKTVISVIDKLLSNSVKSLSSKEGKNDSYVLLKNATIIDVVSDTGRKGDLLIKNEKIVAINYQGNLQTPEGAVTYDFSGKYIIPGLIDNHVHITHGTLKDAQEHLYVALKRGVTGVRDMGGDGRMLTLLKKNMQIGEDVGPDVFFSTIIAGPSFFKDDPRPQQVAKGAIAGQVPWQRAVTINSDFKQIIAEVKGMGATAIKVYLNVDKDTFKKVATEAKRQGLKVWAHAAVPPTRPLDITNGGADVMSHAGDMVKYEFVKGDLKGRHDFESREKAQEYRKMLNSVTWDKNSPEVIRLFNAMKKNNSILDATLHVYDREGRDKKDIERALKVVKVAYDMGVKVCAGSDNMITDEGYSQKINIHNELELLSKAGLSNIDVLRAATIINAEGLGEESNIGTIEKGKLANLVILNSNPLEDIKSTRDIKQVIKRGKMVN